MEGRTADGRPHLPCLVSSIGWHDLGLRSPADGPPVEGSWSPAKAWGPAPGEDRPRRSSAEIWRPHRGGKWTQKEHPPWAGSTVDGDGRKHCQTQSS